MAEKENLVKKTINHFVFEEFLFHLTQFLEEEKHLNVKQKYVCTDNYPLGQWVACVRSGRAKISEQQKQQLNELGFVWNAKKVFDFDTFLAHFVEYKQRYHTAKVDMNKGGYVCSDGYKLGKKVDCIRTGHIRLNDKQKQILDELGFVWNAKKVFDFEKFCEMLKKYKQNSNSMYVPKDVVIDGYNLGNNACHVRAGEIKLSLVQKAILNEMGFVWDQSREFKFDLFVEKLNEFKQKHKSLNVKNYCVIDGYPLGNKVANIRTGIIHLSRAQKQVLNDMGFDWMVTYPNKLSKFVFDEFYQNLFEYIKLGGDLLVPYQTVINNYQLGFYARNIRNFRISLTGEQKAKLTALGFVFNTHNYYQDKDIPLIKKMVDGDSLARKKVIEDHMPYVAMIARGYSGKANYSDLLDIANNTLILCADRCNESETFKPYLKKAVKGSIIEFLYSSDKPASLSTKVSKCEDITLEESIEDNTFRPDTAVEDRTFNNQLMKMAKQILSDDEFKLICLRFGFNKKAIAYTSDQLATIFKTSVKKVQIVLNRILLKLKQNLKREEWII